MIASRFSTIGSLTGQTPSGAEPVRIICGHYGSGKTEFAVNLALREAHAGHRVALADLDIVNPYFRSRERADLLEASGIRVISSSLGHITTLEIPAISAEIRGPLAEPDTQVILDMGGDSTGAKILAQFYADVRRRESELLLVVNAYRPETTTLEGVLGHLEQIEFTTRLTVTGLVSATHLLRDTTVDDVRVGLELCREVSRACGVRLAFVAAIPDALAALDPGEAGDAELLPVGMHLRDEWM
ncbi:MAG TPA: hypothetical protein PKX10_11075 [Propioniciclava tarda]|nr:hypothetical protein [Propioniciclava tarda]HQA31937.1 hypothetical protein [Propioniciclava tarda]HQD61649.1 hypothetical protein [Propioniciclava tarda]